MHSKKELRSFVEALIKGQINYDDLSKNFKYYLDVIYGVYRSLLITVSQNKKEGMVNNAMVSELKDIISSNLLDLYNPRNIDYFKSELFRLRDKYSKGEVNNSLVKEGAFVKSMGNYIHKLTSIYQGRIAPVIAVIGFILSAASIIKLFYTKRKNMANVLATNSEFTKVYKTFIYPQLNGVLDDIISGKIDNEYQLKESFYKMISDIKNYDFNLYYGIRGWIPQYK